MYKEVFQIRIKQIRQEIGLTQSQVAAEIEQTRANISKYENGKLEPGLETIGKLATLYNTSCDWLFGLSLPNKMAK
mgnify:CR=1 FL=1